jgi:hypothetical protein
MKLISSDPIFLLEVSKHCFSISELLAQRVNDLEKIFAERKANWRKLRHERALGIDLFEFQPWR